MTHTSIKIVALSLWITQLVFAQNLLMPSDSVMNYRWKAYWACAQPKDQFPVTASFFGFRKRLDLAVKPNQYVINISADNRYRLFVNGKHVAVGPARGDAMHYRFETLDIAPYLNQGSNTIAVMVWHWGEYSGNAQKTWNELKAARLIVNCNTAAEQAISTPKGWKYTRIQGISPVNTDWSRNVWGFESASIGERHNAAGYPWGWEQPDYNDSKWEAPATMQQGFTKQSTYDAWIDNLLTPRTIPLPEERLQTFTTLRTSSGITMNDAFIKGKGSIIIPANTKATMLIDQGVLTQGFPEMLVSKGAGSRIRAVYAEGLVTENKEKFNRNDIANKSIKGLIDHFEPDGGLNRLFRPTWYRCFRYIQLEIETAAEPLELQSYHFIFTAYPFVEKGYFKSSDPQTDTLWRVGWRTARLCAYETYMDCPYFEQLQYIGDTRIQALISLYTSGDDRLMRNAIDQFDNSINADGLTTSSYPAIGNQIIPPFSLFWIMMVYDYWMHRPDEAFCKQYVLHIKGVLDWHKKYVVNGMQTSVPFWNFVDWPVEWKWNDTIQIGGVPNWNFKGDDAILSLQYAYTLTKTAEMFEQWGYADDAKNYRNLASTITKAVKERCWVAEKRMLADNSKKIHFSQHANLWVVLLDMIPANEQADFIQRIYADKSLIQCTIYYRFYLFQALKKAGLGHLYMDKLNLWRDMIANGLTTFAETPEPTRSDCHAWSASPLYDMLATTLGVEPAAPGFAKIKITPRPGTLTFMEGLVPHPNGVIKVNMQKQKNKKWDARVTIPTCDQATLVWKGKEYVLKQGTQRLTLE